MIPASKVIAKTREGTQYAALCYRKKPGRPVEILLITSRGTGRWIPPKGWPMDGLGPAETAAQEALEEAGVTGAVHPFALGRYKYHRIVAEDAKKSTEAFIFPLCVTGIRRNFKEKGQRKVKWFDRKIAALLVREPKLRKIIRDFKPKHLKTR